MEDGLVELVQFLGHNVVQIWRHLTFFLWGYTKTKVNDITERNEQEMKALRNKRHWKMFLMVL